jgi:hypothetical protein
MSKHQFVAALKLLPHILFVVYNIVYITVGLFAVSEDWDLRNSHCGKTTHIFKFAVLNLVFGFMNVISYLTFPGGGEGARARAIVITSMHFAFMAWGALMWIRLDDLCSKVLGGNSPMIFTFQHLATIGNGVMFGLMAFHEGYLGDKVGYDQTLRPLSDGCYQTYDPHAVPQSQQSQPKAFSDVQDVPKSYDFPPNPMTGQTDVTYPLAEELGP